MYWNLNLDINQNTDLDVKSLNQLLLKYSGALTLPQGSLKEEEKKLLRLGECLEFRGNYRKSHVRKEFERVMQRFYELAETVDSYKKKKIPVTYWFSEKHRKFISDPEILEKEFIGVSVAKCQELNSVKNALVYFDVSNLQRIAAFEITKFDVFISPDDARRIVEGWMRAYNVKDYVPNSKFLLDTGLDPLEDLQRLKTLHFRESDYIKESVDKYISLNYFLKEALIQDYTSFYSAIEETNYLVTALCLEWLLRNLRRRRIVFQVNGVGESFFILQLKKEYVPKIRELLDSSQITVDTLGKKVRGMIEMHSITKEMTQEKEVNLCE